MIFYSTEFGRFALIVVMCLGFIMLDVVYMTVVISYCVQCFLLIFYVEGLQEKVREREYSLQRAMKVCYLSLLFPLILPPLLPLPFPSPPPLSPYLSPYCPPFSSPSLCTVLSAHPI